MSDKIRHRPGPAPHGFLPNWALVAIAAGATLIVGIARAIA